MKVVRFCAVYRIKPHVPPLIMTAAKSVDLQRMTQHSPGVMGCAVVSHSAQSACIRTQPLRSYRSALMLSDDDARHERLFGRVLQ
jgi:hypothetical protein